MILGGRRGEVPSQRLTPKPMQRKKINEKKLPLMLFFLVESVESLLFPNSEGDELLFKNNLSMDSNLQYNTNGDGEAKRRAALQ